LAALVHTVVGMLDKDYKRLDPGQAENDERSDRGGIEAFIASTSLTEGQQRRLRVLQSVEAAVTAKVEELCSTTPTDVTDVAVLVVAPEARSLLFEEDDVELGTSVVVGERDKLYEFLSAVLPPGPDAPVDPYGDLLVAAPALCVRVLVLDRESLTVLSYGTFLTVRLDQAEIADA
jgi:hypothetical protein